MSEMNEAKEWSSDKRFNIFQKLRKRSRFLRWSLDLFEKFYALRTQDSPLREAAKKTRYPFRALRYWHAVCAIMEEYRRLGRPLVIIDLGCKRGTMKSITQPINGAHWIGLDIDLTHPSLARARYDEVYAADFDEPLPLPGGLADIVLCLHVFEHLPRPEFTIREVARIMQPGGIFLAGSPVLPKWLAAMREKQFRNAFTTGRKKRGHHINCFWPERWCRLAQLGGLQVEFMFGSHFFRWSGNPFENYCWWVRLNQLWGLVFPSLGRDIFFQARKTDHSGV